MSLRTRKAVLWFLIVVALIVIVFLPTLQNHFLTNWDDQWMVLENPYLNEFSFSAVLSIFTESYSGQYSPLNTLMYLAITELVGMEAWGFHLMSLLIHLANFWIVGLFLKKLLVMIPAVTLSLRNRNYVAWGTALLFAIHPMQVESVAWISASKVLLYSFFYLAGLLCYLYYRNAQESKYLWMTLVLFLCALLSKEQAVVFILSLIVIDVVTTKDLKKKRIWIEKIPFFVLAGLFSGFTLWLQSGGIGGSNTYPFYQRVVFATYSFWEYLIKLIIPYKLSHFYFFPMDIGEAMPPRLWFYLVATVVLGWLLMEYRQRFNRLYLFGALFFLINLMLVLHLIPISRFAVIADRYVYLSSIGFFLMVTYTLAIWLTKGKAKYKKLIFILAGVYLLVLAGYTHQRTKVWKNMETLNRDVEQAVEKHMGGMEYLGRLQDEMQ